MIGISRDSQETNDRFRESQSLPYRLVGDPDGRIGRAYQASWPLLGLARRVTFVIGTDRKISMAFHSEFKPAAHAAEVCEAFSRRP